MPVYNAERYVAEAVESILDQTLGDFEFLIVDDGSTDGSRRILERYAARDPRIRLASRPNTGYLVALNEMLAAARGEFIARMDSDDVALPGAVRAAGVLPPGPSRGGGAGHPGPPRRPRGGPAHGDVRAAGPRGDRRGPHRGARWPSATPR